MFVHCEVESDKQCFNVWRNQKWYSKYICFVVKLRCYILLALIYSLAFIAYEVRIALAVNVAPSGAKSLNSILAFFYGLRLTKTKFRPLIWVLCQNIIDNFNDNLSKCHHFMPRTRWFDLSRSACVILAYNWRKVTVLIAASKIDDNLTIILKSLPQFSPNLLNEFHFIQISPVLIIFICRWEGEVLQCRDLNFRHLKAKGSLHISAFLLFFFFLIALLFFCKNNK